MRSPRVVEQFENAVRMHEMKGAACPGEWEDIEENFRVSKEELLAYIRRLRRAKSTPS